MKKIFIVLLAATVGMLSFVGCTQTGSNTSVPSEQSQDSEQTSDESSEQSQSSEQTSDESFEQSQSSEHTSDESSEQSQDSEQTSDESSEQSQSSEHTSDESSEQSQVSEQTSNESTVSNNEQSDTSKDESNSKLTLSKVKDIIAKHDDFEEIFAEIEKIQKSPDKVHGNNVRVIDYWLDGDWKEKIRITYQSQIIEYIVLDSDANIVSREMLYNNFPDE